MMYRQFQLKFCHTRKVRKNRKEEKKQKPDGKLTQSNNIYISGFVFGSFFLNQMHKFFCFYFFESQSSSVFVCHLSMCVVIVGENKCFLCTYFRSHNIVVWRICKRALNNVSPHSEIDTIILHFYIRRFVLLLLRCCCKKTGTKNLPQAKKSLTTGTFSQKLLCTQMLLFFIFGFFSFKLKHFQIEKSSIEKPLHHYHQNE